MGPWGRNHFDHSPLGRRVASEASTATAISSQPTFQLPGAETETNPAGDPLREGHPAAQRRQLPTTAPDSARFKETLVRYCIDDVWPATFQQDADLESERAREAPLPATEAASWPLSPPTAALPQARIS